MNLTENAAYLKGMAEGLKEGMGAEVTPKDKLIEKLLDLTIEMAETIESLQKECEELREYADELDSDLGDVEEYLFADDDDEDDYDEDETYEVTCPSCGEVVCFDDSIDPEDLICPACGEEFGAVCDCEDCEECDCEDCDKAD